MRIVRFEDAREFQKRADSVLGGREAEMNFMIGLIGALAEHGWEGRYEAPPLLAMVEDGERAVGVAVRTPPLNLLVSELPGEVVTEVCRWVRGQEIDLPGVMGPAAASEAIAAEWSRMTGCRVRLAHALRTHQLTTVIAPPAERTPAGEMRQATAEDFDLLVSWTQDFERDTEMSGASNAARTVQRHLDAERLFVWEDEKPVAMAAYGQPTPNGMRIYLVYTPPEHRRRGYATALVARLSQRVLESGRKFCFLFTDVANPTSNGIYRSVGYEPVCDFAEYRFAPAP